VGWRQLNQHPLDFIDRHFFGAAINLSGSAQPREAQTVANEWCWPKPGMKAAPCTPPTPPSRRPGEAKHEMKPGPANAPCSGEAQE
jgi:hypothetical protein